MPPTQNLVDNFDDNSINRNLWTNFSSDSNVVETGGALEITTTAAANYFTLYSLAAFSLVGSYVRVELVNAGNQALTTRQSIVAAELDANNKVYMQVGNSTLEASKVVAGAFTSLASIAYNSTTQKYLRVRESAGTTYWEYSADNVTYTTLHSEANPITLTSVYPYIQAGNYAAEASTSTTTFDNFNVFTATGAWLRA